MAWSMEGAFFENCSCTAICPCTWSNLAHRATNDYCRAALAFEVQRGDVEGTDVSGRTFVLVLGTGAQMLEGGWTVGVLLDDGASEEQASAIGRVVSGELGGVFAALGPLIGEFLGIERVPIDITSDGDRHHVRAGGIDYTGEVTRIENGDPVQLTNIVVHPAGPTLAVAPVSSATNSAFGLSWSGQDLSGFANRFAWAA